MVNIFPYFFEYKKLLIPENWIADRVGKEVSFTLNSLTIQPNLDYIQQLRDLCLPMCMKHELLPIQQNKDLTPLK